MCELELTDEDLVSSFFAFFIATESCVDKTIHMVYFDFIRRICVSFRPHCGAVAKVSQDFNLKAWLLSGKPNVMC